MEAENSKAFIFGWGIGLLVAISEILSMIDEGFPQPARRDGLAPCGECRLNAGEVCDICGAVEPLRYVANDLKPSDHAA